MTKTIEAVYENGVLKPVQPLDLPDHQRVFITVDVPAIETPEEALRLWQTVYEGLATEEIAEVEAIALDRSNFMRPEK